MKLQMNLSKLVNFCVAILILKMEENKQHFYMLRFITSRKVKHDWSAKKRFVQVWRRCWEWPNVSKWRVQFCAADVTVDCAPLLHRPAEVDRVDSDQIKILTENNQRSTMREMYSNFWRTHNIQTKEGVGENKCISYFMGKKCVDFWTNPVLCTSLDTSHLH